MQATSERLLEIVHSPSREIRLAEAALLLAQEQYPVLDVEKYLSHLDNYASSIIHALPLEPNLGDLVFSLNTFLFDDMGFSGLGVDTAMESGNYLNRVIDMKRGSPITLAIIYMEVGRRLGMEFEGVFFPGHFLVKLRAGGFEAIIDPLSGGLSMMEDELDVLLGQAFGTERLSPSSMRGFLGSSDDREVLVCMLRGLKSIYLKQNDIEKALWSIERILAISPGAANELRDRAALYEHLGYTNAAAADYSHYLELVPGAIDEPMVRNRLTSLLHSGITLH